MGGVRPDPDTGLYNLWVHENGLDRVDLTEGVRPIRSFFETPYFGGIKNTPPDDRGLSIQQLEPDFVQAGDLSVFLLESPNAKSVEHQSATLPIRFIPTIPQEQLVSFKETTRLARLHVESNTLGGNYIAGRNLLHMEPADARRTS